MANKLKYGNQRARCWFLISPDRIRMLIIKWMDRMVSSWMRDIFSFGVCLVGVPLLVPGMLRFSDTGALGLLVVIIGRQAGYGEIGVEMAEEAVGSSELS
jgi:hypothetical protein